MRRRHKQGSEQSQFLAEGVEPSGDFDKKGTIAWVLVNGSSEDAAEAVKQADALARNGESFMDKPFVKSAHILNNPTQPTHCPFCGSGDIFGRSDGVIECGFCTRGCVIMEQPLHTAMPGNPDGGAKPAATTPDPAVPEVDPNVLATAPAFVPEDEPADDPKAKFMTEKGARLTRTAYVTHLAYAVDPETMRDRG